MASAQIAHVQINEQEVRTQQTFTGLMWALSYPGRIQRLGEIGQRNFLAIAETLIDLETSYYTPDPDFMVQLTRLGASQQPIGRARYLFYPHFDSQDVQELHAASVGTLLSPDDSATLVIGCSFDSGARMVFSGPGVKGKTSLLVGGIPNAFWSLRAEKCVYPLGWDIFLVSGNQLVGLPRTTRLEV